VQVCDYPIHKLLVLSAREQVFPINLWTRSINRRGDERYCSRVFLLLVCLLTFIFSFKIICSNNFKQNYSRTVRDCWINDDLGMQLPSSQLLSSRPRTMHRPSRGGGTPPAGSLPPAPTGEPHAPETAPTHPPQLSVFLVLQSLTGCCILRKTWTSQMTSLGLFVFKEESSGFF